MLPASIASHSEPGLLHNVFSGYVSVQYNCDLRCFLQIRLKEEQELEREWERRRVTEARAGIILDSQLAKKRKQLTKQLAEENRQLADEQRATYASFKLM